MRKFLPVWMALAVAVALTACKDDDTEPAPGPGPGPGPEPDSVVVVQPVTVRGTLDVASELSAVWPEGARLGLYCAEVVSDEATGVANLPLTLGEGAGTVTATFENSLKMGADTMHFFYGYYPYDEAAGASPTTVAGRIATEQSASDSVWMRSTLVGSASVLPTKSFASEGTDKEPEIEEIAPAVVSLGMTNLFAVLDFTIGTDGFAIGENVSELIVRGGEGAVLTGAFTADLTASPVVPAFVGNNASDSVVLRFDGVQVAEGETIRAGIVVNPGDYTGKELSVSLKVGGYTLEYAFDGGKYEADGVYPVRLDITDQFTTNLNEGGVYANSYIVGEPGTKYKFDARVQGNGQATTGIVPAAIDPKYAFVVWESSDELGGVIGNVTLGEDGFVTFTTSDQIGGNALIAVTDGIETEDFPLGTILWSWHIWSTDRTADSDVKCLNADGDSFTFMDRNLGALSIVPESTDSYGLKYQWGRKDPFYYNGILSNGTVTTGVVTDGEHYGWMKGSYYPEGEDESLAFSIMYPTAFFSGSYMSGYDWFYGGGYGVDDRDNNLWGNPDGTTGVKTIYDPCPAGYMVAPQKAFTGFAKSGDYTDGWIFPAEDGATTYFPACGYLNFSSGVLSAGDRFGHYGYYWTSAPKENAVQALGFKIESLAVNPSQMSQRACGYAVRCIREQ